MNNDLYDIDIVSERLGVTPAIVRRYTRLGMGLPGAWRGRQALYTAADLARLRKIVRLTRDLGLSCRRPRRRPSITTGCTALTPTGAPPIT
jgi:hypothetical protein